MDPRIILHLLRTNWLRLRKPVIVLWIVWLLTALPWFLRDPHGFTLPFYQESGGNGALGSAAEMALHANPWSREFLLWGNFAAAVMGWVLAALIGMAGKPSRAVQPIRWIERTASHVLAIVLFLVLPKALLVAAHLLLQGFSVKVMLLGTLNHAVSAGLLAGSVALFASWCSSGWAFLVGLAVLASAGTLLETFSGSRRLAFSRFTESPWISPTGWEVWLFGAGCVVLLGGFHSWFRSRLGMPGRIAVAAGLVLLSGYLADSPSFLPKISPSPSMAMRVSPRPVIRKAWMEQESWPQGAAGVEIRPQDVMLDLDTEACPEGCAVEWEPDGPSQIIQGSGIIAEVINQEYTDSRRYSATGSAGQFIPENRGDRPWSYQAAVAALPERSKPISVFEWDKVGTRFPREMGSITLRPGGRIIPDAPLRLKGNLRGTVYRYESVADVPLGEEPVEVRRGNVVWRIRRFSVARNEVIADLVVSHPALGRSSDPDEVRWDASPFGNCVSFFHLPKSGVNVRLQSGFNADGPWYAGAGWHRRLFRVDPYGLRESIGEVAKLDFEGARLVILKPVVAAVLTGVEFDASLFPKEPGEKFRDFQMNHRYLVDARNYQEDLLPHRPDPRTCTRGQFGRWLRISSAVAQAGSQPERDLACYAPRFADIMAKVAPQYNVRSALRLGTPDSARHLLLENIATDDKPNDLVRIAIDRGWAHEARESILERARQGQLSLDATLYLEDSSTYPALLEKLVDRPDLDFYENLRLLPGIEPALSRAIHGAIEGADLPRLKSQASNDRATRPFGPFILGAKVGDPRSLDAVIALLESGREEGATFYQTRQLAGLIAAPPFFGNVNKAWLVYLTGKTSADFQYDPLARVWRLRKSNSQTP